MALLDYNPATIPWLNILYQDNDLIVIDKPSGLLSVPGNSPKFYDSATNRIKDKFGFTEPIHRLDMATSGVLLFGMNKFAEKELKRQFRARETEKTYEALVWGHLENDVGFVNLPLICDWENRPRQRICFIHGKKAYTEYKVVARYTNNTTRVMLYPKTGRSHQLRLHMFGLGHPILGDKFYAHPLAKNLANRLTLHAKELTFTHPKTNKVLKISAPTPF